MIEYWVHYKGLDDELGVMGKFFRNELAEYMVEELLRLKLVKEAWIEVVFDPTTPEKELEI